MIRLGTALVAPALVATVFLASGCGALPFCLDCIDLASGGNLDGGPGDGMSHMDGTTCVPMLEICNGKDDDCDGLIDNGDNLPGTGGECGTDQGECKKGTLVCTNGAIVCGGGVVTATAEVCDGLDNDCDGLIDNGNPGGGVPCGNGTGDCVQGMTACTGGMITCVGGVGPMPEVCDGHDNNCDGNIDEGNPGGGATCGAGPDVCVLGAVTCVGGQLQCIGAGPAIAEKCNNVDDNCNGQIDEGFNVATDPNNCGTCNNVCMLANATAGCAAGACTVKSCAPDHFDLDHDPTNGCEYACTPAGVELCNGKDDDCNGIIDDPGQLVNPDFCQKTGECAGTTPTCDGVAGWVCHYGATVSTNSAGQIVPETNCDNKDNDCNAVIDDTFPNRGKVCTKGLGACVTNGTQVCNGTHDGLVCNAATPPSGTPEICNGVDDDCDGAVDNGAPDAWVAIVVGGVTKQIYQYEASHPDATGIAAGSLTNRSCSVANHLPWTNVAYPDAVAACTAAGARLCTETEWQTACQTAAPTPCTWSEAASCTTYQQDVCNDGNHDSDNIQAGIQNAVASSGSFTSCTSSWSGVKIYDLSGNVFEWAQARSAGVNPLRGGAYTNPQGGTTCQASFPVADDTYFFPDTGFRCCKD